MPRYSVILCFLLLAACNRTQQPPPKLTIFGLSLEAGRQLSQDAIEEFTRRTGTQVEFVPTTGVSEQQLALVLKLFERQATSPDIYVVDTVWPGAVHQYLLDLTPYLNEESRHHLPALLENDTISRRLVSLPFYMNAGVLFYRADLLRKYGYSAPPSTWDELRRMALHIQQGERRQGNRAFWGYVWQGRAYEGLTCNALEWQTSFGGGHIIEPDGTVTVNNPRTVQAMKNAAAWVGSISPETVTEYTEGDAYNVFRTGNAAFMRHWSSASRRVSNAMQTGEAAVALLPAGPAGRAQNTGGFHLGVSRFSAHPREAVELVLFLTGVEVQKRRALRRGYLPTYPHLYDNPELTRALPEIRVLRHAPKDSWVMRPSSAAGAGYSAVSRAYYQTVHAILTQRAPAETALLRLEQELKRLSGADAKTRRE